jgi:hypothetical protein
VPCFAVSLSSRPTSLDGILLMVEDRREAEEIAAEVRRKGHRVMVREISDLPSLIPTSEESADDRGRSVDQRPHRSVADGTAVRSGGSSVRSSGPPVRSAGPSVRSNRNG